MDYSNEEWIKVYTRDTAAWRCTSLAARGLALEINRNMGRFTDEISLGSRGLQAVAALVSATWTEVEPLLEELIRDGRLVYDPERQVLIDPNHLERQKSTSSPAQRKRDSRKAGVTLGHALSRAVTRGHDQKREIRSEESEGEDAPPPVVADAPSGEQLASTSEDEPPAPESALTLDTPIPPEWRSRAVAIAQRASIHHDPDGAWRRYVAWCVEHGHTPNEARWARWVEENVGETAAGNARRDDTNWGRLRAVAGGRSGLPADAAPFHLPANPPDTPDYDRETAVSAAAALASGAFFPGPKRAAGGGS